MRAEECGRDLEWRERESKSSQKEGGCDWKREEKLGESEGKRTESGQKVAGVTIGLVAEYTKDTLHDKPIWGL